MVKNCSSCGYGNRDDAAFCSSCGTSLAGAGAPTLKPVPSVRVVTPTAPGGPIRIPAPGQCFYHPSLPAIYVCNRCGRSICRDDSKNYMDLVLCPQCYVGIVPVLGPPVPAPAPAPAAPAFYPAYPLAQAAPPRALYGFILAMISGIMIIVNAAALLASGFYAMWTGIFFWIPVIDASASHGLIFALGMIIGLILVVGSILMLWGYGTIGSIVVFPLAVLSLFVGGGFVAGFILGVLGGILGMLGR